LNLTLNILNWTAIIPAAGKGSRLNYELPKILYPILGKEILWWLVRLLSPFVSNFIFVVSPEGLMPISSALKKFSDLQYQIVIQDRPTGMADAILLSKNLVKTENSIIIWGDQALLSAKTIYRIITQHDHNQESVMTFPTVIRENPYVGIVRNSQKKIISINLKREGSHLKNKAENDCGVFCVTNSILFSILEEAKQKNISSGLITKEFNFLTLLPFFEIHKNAIQTIRITDKTESIGINNDEEAQFAEKILIKRNLKNVKGLLSIIIPAFNEERTISNVISEVKKVPTEILGYKKEIIIIDDGSTDRTFEFASKFKNVRLVKQKNQGKGSAVKQGISISKGDFIIIQDADLEYSPLEYLDMLLELEKDKNCCIYGSRAKGVISNNNSLTLFPGKHPKQGIGPWLANFLISTFILFFYRKIITDPLTAYKLYPANLIKNFKIETSGFETDHELTAKIIRSGCSIKEVPISYNPRSKEEGKKIKMADGFKAIITLLKYRFIQL
jgi:dolichol-phosphate mannosyltransferase